MTLAQVTTLKTFKSDTAMRDFYLRFYINVSRIAERRSVFLTPQNVKISMDASGKIITLDSLPQVNHKDPKDGMRFAVEEIKMAFQDPQNFEDYFENAFF